MLCVRVQSGNKLLCRAELLCVIAGVEAMSKEAEVDGAQVVAAVSVFCLITGLCLCVFLSFSLFSVRFLFCSFVVSVSSPLCATSCQL